MVDKPDKSAGTDAEYLDIAGHINFNDEEDNLVRSMNADWRNIDKMLDTLKIMGHMKASKAVRYILQSREAGVADKVVAIYLLGRYTRDKDAAENTDGQVKED